MLPAAREGGNGRDQQRPDWELNAQRQFRPGGRVPRCWRRNGQSAEVRHGWGWAGAREPRYWASVAAQALSKGALGAGTSTANDPGNLSGAPSSRFIHLKTTARVALLGSSLTPSPPLPKDSLSLSWEKETH